MEKQPISLHLEDNIQIMRSRLPIQESFDLLQRNLIIGGQESCFYYVNGFANEETIQKILNSLLEVKREQLPKAMKAFAKQCVPYASVDFLTDFDAVIKNVLSGLTCLFID